MKITSATLVSLVGILGALATALASSANPQLVLAGVALSAVYTVCHAFLNKDVSAVVSAPKAPAAAPEVPPSPQVPTPATAPAAPAAAPKL